MSSSKFSANNAGKEVKFTLHLILAVFITFGLTVSCGTLLADWRAPTVAPPGGNLARPIYSSSSVGQIISHTTAGVDTSLVILGDFVASAGAYIGGVGLGINHVVGGVVGNDELGWASLPVLDVHGGSVHIQEGNTPSIGLLLGGGGATIQGVHTITNPPQSSNLILNPGGGNVGIGEPNPTWKLQVNAAGTNGIYVSGGPTGVAGLGSTYGVFGQDSDSGVHGYVGWNDRGIHGQGGTYGVVGNGTEGNYFSGGIYGVFGRYSGATYAYLGHRDGYGVYAVGAAFGVWANRYGGGGCDLAENYKLSDSAPAGLEPGDIVSIDGQEELAVVKSGRAYDRDTVGIVSTEPSITMNVKDGDGNEGHYPVALIGRVPTKVTGENGPIKIGDLIVTSSKPGYGMRCDDYDRCKGAVVGKALENFEGGEGKIEVLIKTGF